MIGCYDLQEKAELFATDVRLQSVSSILKNLLEGKVLVTQEKELLRWAGKLVGEVDWDSSAYKSRKEKKGVYFLLITNKIRPIFYQTFLDMRVPLNRDFLDRLYETLCSSGDRMQLNPEELRIAQQLTHFISHKIFSRLSYDTTKDIE